MAILLAILETAVLLATGTLTSQGHALAQGLLLSACCALAFYLSDLYDLRSLGSWWPLRLLAATLLGLSLAAGVQALHPRLAPDLRGLATALPFALAASFTLRGVVCAARRRHPFVERVLILGSGPLARKIAAELQAQPLLRHELVGFAEDDPISVFPSGCLRLGRIERLGEILAEFCPDRIVVALGDGRGRLRVDQLLEPRLRGVRVEDGVEAYERLTGKLAIESVTRASIVFSRGFRESTAEPVFARVLSLTLAIPALLLLSPLLALVALLIRLDSRGPVFFVQERAGLLGLPFKLIKFRTMHEAAARASEWARDNDERITRVGRLLRRFRIDELPQLLNVLRGDMNLLGPRPHPVSNLPLFLAKIPYYRLRLLVRPGMTGWAQVRYGYANGLEEETEKVRYDLFYIKHMSPWLDLRILFDTFKIVLLGREVVSVPADAAGGPAPSLAEGGGWSVRLELRPSAAAPAAASRGVGSPDGRVA